MKSISASMLIRRDAAEIFNAFVDPELLCRFWLDSASGPLAPGAEVQWHFKVPGVRERVKVTGFEPPHRLAFRFADGIEVEMSMLPHEGGTRVEARCTGFPDSISPAEAGDIVEGFSIVLCDCKTLLESGRSANLVRDKAVLIAHRMQSTGR